MSCLLYPIATRASTFADSARPFQCDARRMCRRRRRVVIVVVGGGRRRELMLLVVMIGGGDSIRFRGSR